MYNRGTSVTAIARVVNKDPRTARKYISMAVRKTESIKKETNSGTPGEIASLAFKLFKKGGRPADLVIKLKLPPEEAWNLYNSYEKLKVHDTDDCAICRQDGFDEANTECMNAFGRLCTPCYRCRGDVIWWICNADEYDIVQKVLREGRTNRYLCHKCSSSS
jgi:hypothetical protein